jgi:hypothetical protein
VGTLTLASHPHAPPPNRPLSSPLLEPYFALLLTLLALPPVPRRSSASSLASPSRNPAGTARIHHVDPSLVVHAPSSAWKQSYVLAHHTPLVVTDPTLLLTAHLSRSLDAIFWVPLRSKELPISCPRHPPRNTYQLARRRPTSRTRNTPGYRGHMARTHIHTISTTYNHWPI